MEYIYPDYYKQFHCIAGKCPDTCCAGWQICIDDKTLKKYLRLKGSFGNRLKNSIDLEEKSFRRFEGKCPFLNEEKLCDICLEIGEENLCDTCAKYPRHIEEFENVREVSLSVSCPEAARMMLTKKEPVTFVCEEKESGREAYETFDFFLYTKLLQIREFLIETAQNRELPLANRMAFIAAAGHDLQRRILTERLYETDELLERYRSAHFCKKAARRFENYAKVQEYRYELMQEAVMTLHELEVLRADFRGELWNAEWLLYGTMTRESYIQKRKLFLEEWKQWEIWGEQLLVYFIFTYFCGAVYDRDAYAKLKAGLVHILILEELLFADWLEKGKDFCEQDGIRRIYGYAREVEHSDWNLDYFETLVKKRQVFSLEHLLTLILSR